MPLKDALIGIMRIEKFGFHYLVTSTPSHFLTVLITFYVYRFLVFREFRGGFASYLRFHLVNLANLGLSIVGLIFLVKIAGRIPLIAQAELAIVSFDISFAMHTRFSLAS